MATLLKRDSHNLLPAIDSVVELELKKTKSTLVHGCEARLGEILAAWGTGQFNSPDTVDAAKKEFFAEEVIFDVASANENAGVSQFKKYSFETLNEWFDFLAQFDIADMVVTAVPSSKDAMQIWQHASFTMTSKVTGRSITSQNLTTFEFEGDQIKRAMTIYADPSAFAFLTGVTDTPTEAVKPPAFEPHPDPKSVWEVAFAAWGAGEFAQLETKQAAFDKYVHPEIVIDTLGDVGLPEVFKVFHGHAGCDTWANELMGKWEFTRMETSVEAGLKPGYVLQKLECDVRLEGNEAKGIVMFIETAYDSEGKSVHNKIFWANPQVVGSLYMTASAMAVPRPEPAAAEPTEMSEAPTEVAEAEAASASDATPVAEEVVAETAAEAEAVAQAEAEAIVAAEAMLAAEVETFAQGTEGELTNSKPQEVETDMLTHQEAAEEAEPKAAKAPAAAEVEIDLQVTSFEVEKINIKTIRFMPLKRLLIERGLNKKEANDAPSKFALQEMAKKHADALKIEWTTE